MRKIRIGLIAGFLCSSYIVSAQAGKAWPSVLVYKTKAAYSTLVPVELSADKKKVVSYPAPTDIKTGGGYPLPVSLHNGYWLDKRGISTNTAFLKLTYEEYAKLKSVPSPAELYKMIKDKSPVTELCNCGPRDKYSEQQLNELIDKKQLRKKCKILK